MIINEHKYHEARQSEHSLFAEVVEHVLIISNDSRVCLENVELAHEIVRKSRPTASEWAHHRKLLDSCESTQGAVTYGDFL